MELFLNLLFIIFYLEFKQPGLIELYGDAELEHSDSSDTSDSNNEAPEDNYNIDEEVDDEHCMQNQLDEINPLGGGDNGCHFENISLQIHDNELEEDDDLLEIEYVENSFQEIFESSSAEPSIIMKFTRQRSETDDEEGTDTSAGGVPMSCSYELHGSRGITLGQSIYEIPGNSDEGGCDYY